MITVNQPPEVTSRNAQKTTAIHLLAPGTVKNWQLLKDLRRRTHLRWVVAAASASSLPLAPVRHPRHGPQVQFAGAVTRPAAHPQTTLHSGPRFLFSKKDFSRESPPVRPRDRLIERLGGICPGPCASSGKLSRNAGPGPLRLHRRPERRRFFLHLPSKGAASTVDVYTGH